VRQPSHLPDSQGWVDGVGNEPLRHSRLNIEYADIAQRIEHLPSKQTVESSILSVPLQIIT
jgi:hypothetical protein